MALLPTPAPTARGVVVVDLPNPNWATAGQAPNRLVVFDDGDRFDGRAAIVVQPSQQVWTGSGHAHLVLAGPGIVPIAARYRELRSSKRSGRAGDEPVLVVACFGGSDPSRVGERLAPALRPGRGWRTELILGASFGGSTDGWPLEVVRDPADLADRLAAADIVVLGAGTMKFEAACLGRPSILVAVADDQLAVGPAFAATGAAIYLGDGRSIEPDRVRSAVEELVGDRERRESLGRRAAEVVDGRGAARLAEAIAKL